MAIKKKDDAVVFGVLAALIVFGGGAIAVTAPARIEASNQKMMAEKKVAEFRVNQGEQVLGGKVVQITASQSSCGYNYMLQMPTCDYRPATLSFVHVKGSVKMVLTTTIPRTDYFDHANYEDLVYREVRSQSAYWGCVNTNEDGSYICWPKTSHEPVSRTVK